MIDEILVLKMTVQVRLLREGARNIMMVRNQDDNPWSSCCDIWMAWGKGKETSYDLDSRQFISAWFYICHLFTFDTLGYIGGSSVNIVHTLTLHLCLNYSPYLNQSIASDKNNLNVYEMLIIYPQAPSSLALENGQKRPNKWGSGKSLNKNVAWYFFFIVLDFFLWWWFWPKLMLFWPDWW